MKPTSSCAGIICVGLVCRDRTKSEGYTKNVHTYTYVIRLGSTLQYTAHMCTRLNNNVQLTF
jgi:hypothetical protein